MAPTITLSSFSKTPAICISLIAVRRKQVADGEAVTQANG
jgi:hypothetical protein